ncbi:DUF6776 family protein [Zooshikella sp. RANM57]|uniref:DUF6776 family protein n=1 Tax=Zooshikella sp. RANM57 TaxID=3425863 RepID=UPI003D6FAC63
MTAVKGSKQERLVVVPYHPVRRLLAHLLYWLILLAVGAASFYIGQFVGVEAKYAVEYETGQLKDLIDDQDDKIADLTQKLAVMERSRQIDQHTNESIRQHLRKLQAENLELEQEVSFLKSIMQPTDQAKGLSIQKFELKATDNPRQFQYKLRLTQIAKRHNKLNGFANVTIVGKKAGIHQEIPLNQISKNVDSKDIKLGFVYYQEIPGPDGHFGIMDLPEGFEPEYVLVEAQQTGAGAKRVEKKFMWKKEAQLNVGQG